MNRISEIPLIILAGGKSTRMGSPKGLLEVRGVPWVEQQIKSYQALGGLHTVLVVGAQAEPYKNHLARWKKKYSLTMVENHQWALGPFSSIIAGLSSVLTEMRSGPVFVKPVDVPFVCRDVWAALLMQGYSKDVAIPVVDGKGGHPVLLSEEFCLKLQKIDPNAKDARLDYQIKKLASKRRVRVEVLDPNVLRNINTPEQWNLFLESSDSE